MVKLAALATPAKINLFLRVTGKRADGYHELDSVFVPISLFDRVTVEMRTAGSNSVSLRTGSPDVPIGERNLAVRAARKFLDEFRLKSAVAIELNKQIPIGAGLGGGSSDAAAVLRLMASLCRIEDPRRLAALALSIGADLPFFLDPRPGHVRGVGEQIEPLKRMPAMHFVIGIPLVEVSTTEVFSNLERSGWSGPASESDIASLERGLVSGALLVNDLTASASRKHPEIEKLRGLLEKSGARAAAMTGSGGGVFGVYADLAQAQQARDAASRKMPEARFLCVSSPAASVDSQKERQ
ncbi:MAG TPA: 4-(cytidine 5'-diphospho)-2-C-methyl-D-erythritol kinase [Candidatus Binataceae bacterium]|jgi:4-diphosphocytidyl-2-C-methyl-D-erythritol kinase